MNNSFLINLFNNLKITQNEIKSRIKGKQLIYYEKVKKPLEKNLKVFFYSSTLKSSNSPVAFTNFVIASSAFFNDSSGL